MVLTGLRVGPSWALGAAVPHPTCASLNTAHPPSPSHPHTLTPSSSSPSPLAPLPSPSHTLTLPSPLTPPHPHPHMPPPIPPPPLLPQGLEEMMGSGSLAGFPVVDVKATLYDGSYHDVDSSVLAFQIAARACFREGMKKAGVQLLEPIMKVGAGGGGRLGGCRGVGAGGGTAAAGWVVGSRCRRVQSWPGLAWGGTWGEPLLWRRGQRGARSGLRPAADSLPTLNHSHTHSPTPACPPSVCCGVLCAGGGGDPRGPHGRRDRRPQLPPRPGPGGGCLPAGRLAAVWLGCLANTGRCSHPASLALCVDAELVLANRWSQSPAHTRPPTLASAPHPTQPHHPLCPAPSLTCPAFAPGPVPPPPLPLQFTDKPGGMKLVKASVPLSEMFNYVSTLRGMSKGRAQYTMQVRWVRWVRRGGRALPGGSGVRVLVLWGGGVLLCVALPWCPFV